MIQLHDPEAEIRIVDIDRDIAEIERRIEGLSGYDTASMAAVQHLREDIAALATMKGNILAGRKAIGPFEPGVRYERGSLVAQAGQIWRAVKATWDAPGSRGLAWIPLRQEAEPEHVRTIKALEARIKELEDKPVMIDAGVWDPTESYQPGDLVSHGGSGWICKSACNGVRPGTDSSWRLAIKKEKVK